MKKNDAKKCVALVIGTAATTLKMARATYS